MNTTRSRLFWVACMLIPMLAGCASQNGPAKAAEDYYQALVDRNSDRIATLSCADWEAEAQIELDSLTAVGAALEGMACQETSQNGADLLISCAGKIVLDYNGEIQEIDLSTRTVVVREESGEWRICGFE